MILITADTIVAKDNLVLGKPVDRSHAIEMLQNLSGGEHRVVTGVSLTTLEVAKSFASVSKVMFCSLTSEEIEYYVDKYKPYDKAGAYGIQEWIGCIGISHIEGSYYNVMGLPVQQLYTELKQIVA